MLAADDLKPVLPALAAAYEHATGIKLVPRFDSSASLATQILNGDHADLFLASDYSFPEKVVAEGFADTPEPVPYARGTLVLWTLKSSPLQPLTQNTLRDGRFTTLAIANPEHAPFGRAAMAALASFKLDAALKTKIVEAENTTQAAQYVESGNAQLGLISLTLASTAKMKSEGTFVRIPAVAYPEIRQCAVVMKKSAHRSEAHAFLDWLRSAPVQRNLAQYGLDPLH